MEDEVAAWPDALQAELDSGGGVLRRVTVFRETDSTQDAARRTGAVAGDVFAAARQTRGRGRMGRNWADTVDQGIAVTFVLPRERNERLSFMSAVAAAIAAETSLDDSHTVAIKWPNDIYVGDRKLAGILIEQHDAVALVGIGMNVGQRRWPSELKDHAVSVAQLGADVSRLDVLRSLCRAMNETYAWPGERISKAYHERNLLLGRAAQFAVGGEPIAGTVRGVSVERGLLVDTRDGVRWLPAATTHVLKYE